MSNFVLVHGGFVGGWYWADVAQRWEKLGHRVDVVAQLPSNGPGPGTLGDLAADAAVVRQYVESVDGPVVLVGHSYGGMVITEFADHPGVARTVYVAAAWPSRGQSMMDVLAGGPPMTWAAPHDHVTASVTDDLDLLRRTLCADVEKQQAEADLRRMVPMSIAVATSPSSAPERRHPTTYIICEHDRAIPPAAQEQMAAAADHVERLASSHQPMTSMPDQLAAALDRVRWCSPSTHALSR